MMLEESGVLAGHETRVDPAAVGLGLTAFVFVKVDERTGSLKTAQRLAGLPQVQELHHITGGERP